MKTFLVAVSLLVGGANVWGSVLSLYSQNYESATDASSWVTQSLAPTLVTGDATYGKYIQMSVGNNNSRSTYTTWGSAIYGDYKTYTLEFDATLTLSTNNVNNQSTSFAIMADGYALPTANYSYSSDYIFKITSVANSTTFSINEEGTTYEMPKDVWCHYSIVVDGDDGTATYTITNKSTSTQLATGTYNIPSGKGFKAVGMYYLSGRYGAVGKFDNISITTEVDEEVVSIPTISEPVYAGANRTITITAGESSEDNPVTVTTYYTIDGTDPSSSNYEGSFTTASKEVTITSDCTVKAITISSTDVESSIASRAVTVGMLTLNAPTIWISNLVVNGGVYNATYSFASDQSDLLGSPIATLSYAFAGGSSTAGTSYTPTTAGQLIVTASAEGYTSNSTTIDITLPNYKQTYFADFSTLVKGDASGFSSYNINNTGCDFYTYTNTFDELTLSSLSLAWAITNAYVVGLHARGGAGTITYKEGFAAGSIIDFYCADKTSTYHIYSTTATTTIPQYVGVYNMSIYSPVVSKPITAAGWATYCSPYALDLENATGLTEAYIVTGGAGGVLAMTSVKGGIVPANTGLLLKGDEGTATIPVVASSATDVSANKLVGVTANTEIAAEAGYVLMNDATNGLGFYLNSNAFTVGANTAYLPANFDGSSSRGFFALDGDATGISTIAKSQEPNANSYYDLQGRRVAQPTKGLYIVNGKKVVVK